MTTYRNQPLVAHSTVTVAAAAAAAASAAASASSSSSSSSSSSMIGGRSLRRTAFQRSTHASMEIESSISGEEEEEKKLMMHVSMDNLYNEENKQSILHDSLRFLRLRNPFNHPLTSACFTPVIHSLTSLHVDSKAFNHPIERGVLPLSLLHLHLPSSYSNQFSVAQCLHLQSITFDPSDDFSPPFHSDILADDLPSSGSLRTLKMPFKWRGRFLPSLADPVFRNIISLDIGCGYDYQLPFLLLTTPFHHLTSLSANFAGFVPDVIFYAEHTFDSLASVAHFLSQFIGKDVCVRYTGNSISNECIQQETYSTVINRSDTTVKVRFVMAHFDMRYIINHDPE